MGESLTTPQPSNFLHANLAALARPCPGFAEWIAAAPIPPTAVPLAARDGERTYAWTDDTGRLRWLGRCSTPSLRAAALIDAFQHAGRNTLLVSAGQGAELRLLLQRLLPHQAVFVIEEDAGSLSLILRLIDFREPLAAGRLLLFPGPAAWQDLHRFLVDHPGYLLPERLLAWPWFESTASAELSERVAALNTAIAHDRAARRAGASPMATAVRFTIHAAVHHGRIQQTAERISAAAQAAQSPCSAFILNDPSLVHPAAVEQALRESHPRACLLLDCLPADLTYKLPEGAALTALFTDDAPLRDEALRQSPPGLRLAVSSRSSFARLGNLGIDAARIIHAPPAAAIGLDACVGRPRKAVALVADLVDASPASVGLNLATHERLWNAAREIILDRLDAYRDEDAADVFARAEKNTGARIDSAEVRAGLVDRIRRILGPHLVRRAHLQALARSGIPFEFFGRLNPADADSIRCHRGAWPLPATLPAAFERIGLVISIETGGTVRPWMLDALAAGALCLVRSHPIDESPDGLACVCDPSRHAARFNTREDMIRAIRRFLDRPADFESITTAAAAHVGAHHTWRTRLDQLLAHARSEPRP